MEGGGQSNSCYALLTYDMAFKKNLASNELGGLCCFFYNFFFYNELAFHVPSNAFPNGP